MRKIILTEAQFKTILKSGLLNEGTQRKQFHNSYANRIMSIYDDEQVLKQHGMSLFKDPEDAEDLPEIASMTEKNVVWAHKLCGMDIFADEKARNFVSSIVMDNMNLRGGDNPYADTLTKHRMPAMKGRVEAEKERKEMNMDDSEKAMQSNIIAKRNKFINMVDLRRRQRLAYADTEDSDAPIDLDKNSLEEMRLNGFEVDGNSVYMLLMGKSRIIKGPGNRFYPSLTDYQRNSLMQVREYIKKLGFTLTTPMVSTDSKLQYLFFKAYKNE